MVLRNNSTPLEQSTTLAVMDGIHSLKDEELVLDDIIHHLLLEQSER